jgi:hypothetical protein
MLKLPPLATLLAFGTLLVVWFSSAIDCSGPLQVFPALERYLDACKDGGAGFTENQRIRNPTEELPTLPAPARRVFLYPSSKVTV